MRLVQQLVAVQHAATVVCENLQQAELHRRDWYFLTIRVEQKGCLQIQSALAELDTPTYLIAAGFTGGRAPAAQNCFDACFQFP